MVFWTWLGGTPSVPPAELVARWAKVHELDARFGCWAIELPDGVPSAAFAERLLSEEGVVVLPGSAFGAGGEGFLRVSFITSPARIADAASRAGRVLASFGAEVA